MSMQFLSHFLHLLLFTSKLQFASHEVEYCLPISDFLLSVLAVHWRILGSTGLKLICMDRNWQLSKGISSPDNCCKESAQTNSVSSGIETREVVKANFSKNGWESGLKIHFFLFQTMNLYFSCSHTQHLEPWWTGPSKWGEGALESAWSVYFIGGAS